MTPNIATVQKHQFLGSDNFVSLVRSLHIQPGLNRKHAAAHRRASGTTNHVEQCPLTERQPRSLFEILAADDTTLVFTEPWLAEDGITVSRRALAEQSPVSAQPTPLCCARCGDIIRATTSSPPSTEAKIVPRRRFQKGRVFQRNKIKKWAGSFREEVIAPVTGRLKRVRRTVTFDSSVTSRRAALRALQPYLDRVNADLPSPKRGGKTVGELVEEWKKEIIPNRKPGGARASLSHLRAHIVPPLGKMPLRELNLRAQQAFVTTVGQRVQGKKTVENVFGTLSSILKKGRKWGYFIPDVARVDIEFPSDLKPKVATFFFDADIAARVINVTVYPFRLIFLIAALCYLRIGEVTALKIRSLDFERKVIHIHAALDYATRQEITTKPGKSTASVPMPELLKRHLLHWLENYHVPNPEGYLFVNSNGRPYL